MITPDEIRAVVEQPSKLGPGRDADEYQMEKYQRVAIEAVAAFCEAWNQANLDIDDEDGDRDFVCPTPDGICSLGTEYNCRACWREWLEAQCSP